MRTLCVGALLISIASLSVACGPATRGDAHSPNALAVKPRNAVPVDDKNFARSSYQLLLNGEPSQERADLLAGVVQHQLRRAARRFKTNRPAGMAALTGALYLMRAGELHQTMIVDGAPALSAGAEEVARIGNEGRARALYTMLLKVLPPGAQREDVSRHLQALDGWKKSTKSEGPMQAAGARQRAAVDRAVYEPSDAALKDAQRATLDWLNKALQYNASEAPITSSFERDEAIEAYRAIRSGSATLAALYVRHGNPQGALTAFDTGDLGRVVPPGLRERLERAAEEDDAQSYADLFRLFQNANDSERPETSLDEDLASAGAWGAAVELYRSQPDNIDAAQPLAVMLLSLGMGETAPLVLGAALGSKPSVEALSWSMGFLLDTLINEDQVGQLPAAERAFANSAPFVALAEGKNYEAMLRPSAARVHYVLGALEVRAGELDRARAHVEKAAQREPSLESLMLLAAIDRQQGKSKPALDALDRAIAIARRGTNRAAEAEAQLSAFEIRREQGAGEQAKKSLGDALSATLDARRSAKNLSEQARAERLLARVLEHYGDAAGARRATERAFEASRSDVRQLTATVLDASRRGLTRGDLTLARDAVRRAVEANLEDEDLVYAALWLSLLERKLNVPSDGTADEALASIDDGSGWAAKLGAWGRGKLDDQALIKAAKTRVQQTEADFYTAMSRRASGDEAAMSRLKHVAESPAIELVEVTIARDLVASQKALDVTLPKDVDVP